ncbi:uncharacterized protein [Rutidosis leptorrhynchoides]|uniref:uncharacterized protein n=1 Tax=Rutidosis leptorrhynchoides TaxID=125765 RepID=UPI003A98EDA9
MSLQRFRENGFDELLEDVNSFCQKYDLERLNMDELYVVSRNRKKDFTNQHYFKVDIFIAVLDMIIRELNDRFSDVSTELLNNMTALSPRNSYCMFDAFKLMKLSEMYPMDFNERDRDLLKCEVNIYYEVVRQDDKFSNLKGIANLAKLMVETEKHFSYRYVYRLLKLALVLPVANATANAREMRGGPITGGLVSEPIGQTTTTSLIRLVLAVCPEWNGME